MHAVRNRPENSRSQFSVFIDEFQNFANSEDLATFITEARKYGIATTIAHQERFGQLGENKKLLGATLAAANKVFFQLTVKDAEELALEFVSEPKETEARQEPIFVLSPHPIEDIWKKGHDDKMINIVRKKYFYLVDLLN